jgi:hypothetical protein
VPGIATIAAIPLAVVALQLAIGLPRPWLPRFLADRSLSRAEFATMVSRVRPYLSRVETLLRPRLAWLTGPIGERIVGIGCFAMALMLTIPVLFNLPLVVPIALMALAVLERDGIFAAVGLVMAIVVCAGIATVGWLSLQEGLQLIGRYVGI